MKRAIQHLNTLLITMWALGSVMWIGGESDNVASNAFIGLFSLGCALMLGRELAKRNLLITAEDNDNDKY